MTRRHEDQVRFKTFTRRSLLIGGGQAVLLGALVGRMYYLQVMQADRYATLAEDNRINLRLIAPARGRIVDRFGVPLAVNVQNHRVVLVREQTPDLERTLAALDQIIRLSEGERERILHEISRKRAFVPITVRDQLPWDQVSRIEVNAPDLPGVSIEAGLSRHYPYSTPMAHVLGYVAAVAEHEQSDDPLLELPDFQIGKNGIERQHDLVMRGKSGASQIEVNAAGRVIRELRERRRPPEAGRELVLTLDSTLQRFVQELLAPNKSAAAVVMNLEDGEVLASCSVPTFDSNAFSKGISSDQWSKLVNDPLSPLTNKAIAGLYSPGSTFKMVVALAALQAGVAPGQLHHCSGAMTLGNARFHCWKRGGHGWLDMYGALKHSCDIYFYEMAKAAGIDRMAAVAKQFGIGEAPGLDLPGARDGMMPTPEWKQATLGEPWQGGETLVTAIGQGFILATPLQLAVMAARLGSGRAVVPRLTRGFRMGDGEGEVEPVVSPEFPPLDIPEAHLKVVRAGMDKVVNEERGTAYWKRIMEEGREMAGKTGTSQVRRITLAERRAGIKKNEDLPWRFRDHALFVAYAPVHKPRYACAVVIEHGGGGSKAAAPIARQIMIEVQRRDPSAARGLPLLAGEPAVES